MLLLLQWVGTILLAGATSLPELATGINAVAVLNAPDLAVGGVLDSCLIPEFVASLAAVRLNAVDLAVSNLFGFNLANMAILGIYDLVYLQGNLLVGISYLFRKVRLKKGSQLTIELPCSNQLSIGVCLNCQQF